MICSKILSWNFVAKLTDWGGWSACDCESLLKEKRRQCLHGPCKGELVKHEPCECRKWLWWFSVCKFIEFVIAFTFSVWSNWTECSQTCGGGSQSRDRTCLRGNCPSDFHEIQTCFAQDCPVYGNWSEWTECDVACVSTLERQPTQIRVRKCLIGNCTLELLSESRQCSNTVRLCCKSLILLISWSQLIFFTANYAWNDWSSCNSTCGAGIQTRSRYNLAENKTEFDSKKCRRPLCGKFTLFFLIHTLIS